MHHQGEPPGRNETKHFDSALHGVYQPDAQVQLGFVEDEPPSRPTPSALERGTELLAESARDRGMAPGRPRLSDELAEDYLDSSTPSHGTSR